MGKRKHKSRKVKNTRRNAGPSRVMVAREDNDGVFDEVDRFHMEYDEKLLKIVKQPKRPLAKEVLRVASDEEFSEDEHVFDEEDEGGEEGEDSQQHPITTSNKWGKLSRNYYGSSYVDGDYGGAVMNSDEEEALQLEEEDALARQRKLELANGRVDFERFFDARETVRGRNGEEEEEMGEDGGSCANLGLKDLLGIELAVVQSEKDGDAGEGEEARGAKLFAKAAASLSSNTDSEESGEEDESDVEEVDEVEEEPERKRRKITYEILKNKGIRKDNGRKRRTLRHARVVNRRKFDKALIKKRSQVPDVRRELTRYDGEKRGIRVSTVKSIKF